MKNPDPLFCGNAKGMGRDNFIPPILAATMVTLTTIQQPD